MKEKKMKASPLKKLVAIAGILVIAAALNAGLPTTRVRASTIHTVTSTADSGVGSLRDAVNSSADFDQIVFNLPPHSTITLTSGEIDIGVTLTIGGPGANQLSISGNNSSGVFHITIALRMYRSQV